MFKKISVAAVSFVLIAGVSYAKDTVAIPISCIIPPLVGVNIPESEEELREEASQEEDQNTDTQVDERFDGETRIVVKTTVVK